jgi:N-acetylmuramic acid 6-phosphate etherase
VKNARTGVKNGGRGVKYAGTGARGTELRNPRTRNLDLRSTRGIVDAIHREDARVAGALGHELAAITRAVDCIVRALAAGGRLIYVGAGTSGRLAMLDAAECPPTFGVPAGLVSAVIAGGSRALTTSVEGAEDSAAQGRRDLARRRLQRRDVVVGLSASGDTPYVLGALRFARRMGAATIAVTANRRSPLSRAAQITIAAETGAEAIAGSTRMKAGTAQKMVLNLLSTAAMVRLGHVYDNWMVDVTPSNKKLRQRALGILRNATGASPARAARALQAARENLRVALIMLKTKSTAAQARQRLRQAQGNLRRALGEP